MLIALITYKLILAQQERASLLTLYNKLPNKSQILIKAVQNATKQGTPTIDGIANELNKLTNTLPTKNFLEKILGKLKKLG